MKRYEDAFIEALQTYDPRQENPKEPTDLLAYLHPASRHRWRAYADSYVFRVTNSLTETMLERVAKLYSEGFIKQLLFDYIHTIPPKAALMPDALDGFAEFLASHQALAMHPEIIDLVQLAQKRWKVLIGPDPQIVADEIFADPDAWDRLFLQPNSCFLRSDYPIHSLWVQGNSEALEDSFIPDRAEGVLLCKSSPTVLHHVKIEAPFVGLMSRLAECQSLAEALETVDWDEDKDEAAFIDLLRQLREAAAFITRSAPNQP